MSSEWKHYLARGVPDYYDLKKSAAEKAMTKASEPPLPVDWKHYLARGVPRYYDIKTPPTQKESLVTHTPSPTMTTWGAFLASGPADPNVYLVFGKTGWIGGKLIQLLTAQRKKFFLAESRTYDREAVLKEIVKYNPTHILNAAGVTGRPNVDWCEDHKIETVRTNVIGCLTIADVCEVKKIHHLLYATGCIFEYDAAHPIGGPGFTEEDSANFHASFYSHTKAMVEDLLKVYTQTCTLRVRMPISDDLSHRNFVTKIVKYDKVVNVPNSMTCLTELLPISLVMAEKKLTGIYNFCNPGAISHNEVLGLYKKYVDPSYTWTNFTLDEQAKILKAGRSNNTLDHTKLCAALPGVHIDDIHTAMEKVMIRMQANLEAEGVWPDKLPKRTTAAAIDTKDV